MQQDGSCALVTYHYLREPVSSTRCVLETAQQVYAPNIPKVKHDSHYSTIRFLVVLVKHFSLVNQFLYSYSLVIRTHLCVDTRWIV